MTVVLLQALRLFVQKYVLEAMWYTTRLQAMKLSGNLFHTFCLVIKPVQLRANSPKHSPFCALKYAT